MYTIVTVRIVFSHQHSMPNLTLSFLGPGQILGPNDTEIILRGRKEFALLAYLASEPEHAHRREFLGGLLWPEMAANEFRNNLRVTLSRLKNSLVQQGVDSLIIERQTVQFRPDFDFQVDTLEFKRLRTEVDSHVHEQLSDCQPCQQNIEQALALYNGQFLQGFHVEDSYVFEEWMTYQREHFQRQAIELLGIIENVYLAQGDADEAIGTVRRRIALDPLQEDAHRLLMRLLAQNGERHAALVQYETCRRLLRQELGVPPEPETAELYQQIRDGGLTVAPNGRNPDAPDGAGYMSAEGNADTSRNTPAATQADTAASAALTSPDAVDLLVRRWGTASNQKLFGIEESQRELANVLESSTRPWLVAIDGIGGIGKTSMAQELSRGLLQNGRFERAAWVSAKQEEFLADTGITPVSERPALTADEMVTELLVQLTDVAGLTGSSDERRQQLIQELQESPALLVIDNLETVADYQALVPLLVQLSDPSKVIITSRMSLQGYPDVYARSIGELNLTDSIALLRHEAGVRGMALLLNASDDHLQAIYDVVGGHPLALNLVLGQLTYLPLNHVLTGLQQATGERIEQLYSYIYWQAWQMLGDASRQLFLTLPIVFNGTFEQLVTASLLQPAELQSALTQLIGLSLVQVGGDILEPRYRLHRLTETFLMNEVLKWQSR